MLAYTIHWGSLELKEQKTYGLLGPSEGKYKTVTIDRARGKSYEVVRWKFRTLTSFEKVEKILNKLFEGRF